MRNSKPQFTAGPWVVKNPPMGEEHRPYKVYACPGATPTLIATMPSRSNNSWMNAYISGAAATRLTFARSTCPRLPDRHILDCTLAGHGTRSCVEAARLLAKARREAQNEK